MPELLDATTKYVDVVLWILDIHIDSYPATSQPACKEAGRLDNVMDVMVGGSESQARSARGYPMTKTMAK